MVPGTFKKSELKSKNLVDPRIQLPLVSLLSIATNPRDNGGNAGDAGGNQTQVATDRTPR
jgi:hypothetical protein